MAKIQRRQLKHACNDVANFAPLIQCPVILGAGLRDETCPQADGIAAFNQIKLPKEIVILPKSPRFGTAHQDPNALTAFNDQRWKVWMPPLVRGRPSPVQPSLADLHASLISDACLKFLVGRNVVAWLV